MLLLLICWVVCTYWFTTALHTIIAFFNICCSCGLCWFAKVYCLLAIITFPTFHPSPTFPPVCLVKLQTNSTFALQLGQICRCKSFCHTHLQRASKHQINTAVDHLCLQIKKLFLFFVLLFLAIKDKQTARRKTVVRFVNWLSRRQSNDWQSTTTTTITWQSALSHISTIFCFNFAKFNKLKHLEI